MIAYYYHFYFVSRHRSDVYKKTEYLTMLIFMITGIRCLNNIPSGKEHCDVFCKEFSRDIIGLFVLNKWL